MAQYADVGELQHCPCVTDLVDVDSQKWFDYAEKAHGPLRWLYRLEGRRVRQLEAAAAQRSRAVIVVSEAEANLLRSHCPAAEIVTIQNGVDLDYFHPPAEGELIGSIEGGIAPMDCLFVGALDYRPNVDGLLWFCREVWPEVRRQFPDARFGIVGRNPCSSVRRLMRQLGVEVIGSVPDVRPYLWRSQVVLAPLRIARGIQNKVLEALAARKAVVASPQAIEGLALTPNEHLRRAETAAAWINDIGELLSDTSKRQQLGDAGCEFVRIRHRWEECLSPLTGLIHSSNRIAAVEDRPNSSLHSATSSPALTSSHAK